MSTHLGDAVITDLRRLVRLPEILRNFCQELPASFIVHFLHGDDNHLPSRADGLLKPHLHSRRLRLRHLRSVAPEHWSAALAARDLAGSTLTPNDRAKHLKYVHWNDEMIISPKFWSAFRGRYLMLFETDAALCACETSGTRHPHTHTPDATYARVRPVRLLIRVGRALANFGSNPTLHAQCRASLSRPSTDMSFRGRRGSVGASGCAAPRRTFAASATGTRLPLTCRCMCHAHEPHAPSVELQYCGRGCSSGCALLLARGTAAHAPHHRRLANPSSLQHVPVHSTLPHTQLLPNMYISHARARRGSSCMYTSACILLADSACIPSESPRMAACLTHAGLPVPQPSLAIPRPRHSAHRLHLPMPPCPSSMLTSFVRGSV